MNREAEVDFGLSVFGSFALGAYLAGADMDVLFLAPEQITKQAFLEDCYAMLKNANGTSSLTVVTHEYAPMFMLNFHGVAIKLVFATVPSSVAIGGFAWDDPTFLASLEDAGLGSLNGPRFSGDLKALVPSLSVFQMALCFVKLWAKRRMIYSSTMGYFGGDAWAVMVAYMCRLYPEATISALVFKFFETFSKWQWPVPVGIKACDGSESPYAFWDSLSCDLDPSCSMPIISPSIPYACITHNISKASKALITYELLRGARLSHKANDGAVEWDALLKEPRFFDLYTQYVRIFVCCEDSSKQQSLIGNVELKIRDFAASLAHSERIAFAHTNPFRFTSVYYCRSEIDLQHVKNGILEGALLSLTFIVPTKPVYTTSFYIGIIPNNSIRATLAPEAEEMFALFEDELNAEDFFPDTASVKVSLLTCEDIPPNVYTPPSSC
ncbi:polynucleotide adenylyltransferase, variant 2 [Entomophthora muscae]|nr:polynucleotide adenylyltransferase, variant 2 [Entomophthora muscae]